MRESQRSYADEAGWAVLEYFKQLTRTVVYNFHDSAFVIVAQ